MDQLDHALTDLCEAQEEVRELRVRLAAAGQNAIKMAADHDETREQLAAAENLIIDGIEQTRLTREYVGWELLPAICGWSWFDWVMAARKHLGIDGSLPWADYPKPTGPVEQDNCCEPAEEEDGE